MAGKAAGPERSGGKASRGKKPGSPDRAGPAGQAGPGDSAGRPDKATSADEGQSQFREALERKRAREADAAGAPGRQDAGKVHGAHGPARNRRSFRRKSG
jgi:Family of unknown function (DUF5302)